MKENEIATFNAKNLLVPVRLKDLPPEDAKAIQEAQAQIEAGEGIDGETFFVRMDAYLADLTAGTAKREFHRSHWWSVHVRNRRRRMLSDGFTLSTKQQRTVSMRC